MDHHYIKIIVVRCRSVSNGKSLETIWPRGISGCIRGHGAYKAKTMQSLGTSVMVLATGESTSFLDRLYEKQATMDTCMKWAADSYAACFKEKYCHRHRHVGSRFCSLLLGFTRCLRDSERTNEFLGHLIDLCRASTGCSKCACATMPSCTCYLHNALY